MAGKSQRYRILIFGQVLLMTLDISLVQPIFDALEQNQQKRQCIDILLSLLDKKRDLVSPLLVQRIVDSEGKQKLAYAQLLNKALSKLEINDIQSMTRWMQANLTDRDNDVSTHMFLAIEQLMLERALSDTLVEKMLSDLLASQPDIYNDEKLAFSYT